MHPNNIAFANYLKMLEYAGLTKEHMQATGIWEQNLDLQIEEQANKKK